MAITAALQKQGERLGRCMYVINLKSNIREKQEGQLC